MHLFHVLLSIRHAPTHNTYIPKSLFDKLPAQAPRKEEYKPHLRSGDYRLGPIRIDWVDLARMSSPTRSLTIQTGKERQFSHAGTATASFVARSGATITAESGTTNLPEGVVHIFKADAHTPDPRNASPTTSKLREAQTESVDTHDGTILAVLAVPSWMNPSDFLTFVAPAAEGMAHVRIVRDFAPNRSIVLIKFREAADAQECAEAYNGKPFNSMEPEICQVVRVASVRVECNDVATDNFLRTVSASDSMYELPTCPVCLDRMDSTVTGLVTIPCSHTFHCMCLSKWGDSRCPVCRYSQNLIASSTSGGVAPSQALSVCSDCGSTSHLWICLICGNVGCGRYGRAHAQAHFALTTHLFALELETQRVWDYAGDGYVHRLVQNRADGKVVELPSAAGPALGALGAGTGALGPGPADARAAEKIEAIGLEYSYLLTSQLDSQRAYYEEQADELKARLGDSEKRMEIVAREAEERMRNEAARHAEDAEIRAILERDKERAEKKAEKLGELARRLDKELKEERAVSQGLLKNMAALKAKSEAADADREELHGKVNDLQDQLRDVMFFLEARTKIEQGDGVEAEAAGGSVEVPTSQRKRRGKK